MDHFRIVKYVLFAFVLLLAAGCFDERDSKWDKELLEWEPPDRSNNELSMEIDLEDDETEPREVSIRIQYAGPHKSNDITGTFTVDEPNSNAVEGEHFEILNESNSVTIPSGSSFSEDVNIQINSNAIEKGESLSIILLITNEGDLPPMDNYKEFNIIVTKETGYLVEKEVTLERPGKNAGERILDVADAKPYTTNEADDNPGIQEKIDVGLWNSSSTGFTMIVPTDDDRLSGWGSGRRVRDDWEHRNEGELVKLPFNEDNQDLFDNILTDEDVIAAYEDAEQTVSDDPNLEQDDYGPGGHLQYVTEGEVIFFHSIDRDFYAIFIVKDADVGSEGHATILIKTTAEN